MVLRTADVVVHLWPPSKLQVQNFGKRFPVISLATPYDGQLVRLYLGNRGVTGLPNRRGGVLDAFVDTSISIRSGRSYVTKVGS